MGKSVKIMPGKLSGTVTVPPSKSMAHRAIISAGLCREESLIANLAFSEDISATVKGMEIMGTFFQQEDRITGHEGKVLRVRGREINPDGDAVIDCGESGSTLRFLIPLALLSGKPVTFTGRGKLVQRPLNVYYEIFHRQGISYHISDGALPLRVEGLLKPDTFFVPGDISSQFITGLMFVLPLLKGDSRIIVTSELESRGYVDLTIAVLAKFGVRIENKGCREFIISGSQSYQSSEIEVEGDYSQAAFWLAAGTLGSDIKLKGLSPRSFQGDRVIVNIIEEMGGKVLAENNWLWACPAQTHGIEIDVSQCPDLVPALAVLAALSKGTTRIINGARLRLKESDRLKSTAEELKKLGANIREEGDGLLIFGQEELGGGIVDSWNDHRIAMALAMASLKCRESVVIKNSGAVKKSYPDFWQHFIQLGGNIIE